MGIKVVGYLFSIPFLAVVLKTGQIDWVLLLVSIVCGLIGSMARAAEENQKEPISIGRLMAIFSSGFVTTVFSYGIGDYYKSVIYAMGASSLLSYMGGDILAALKRAALKIISLLPDVFKNKFDKE